VQAGIQVTDVTGIEAGVRVVSGVAVGALKSVGSGVRYAILIISLPLLPVACGGGDEQPAATLSPPQAATSPTTNPTATFPPTSTETTSQTLVVMGGDEGRVDAPPVSVPGRVGRQEPPAHRRPPVRRSHGTGRRPRQGNVDGVSYLTGVIGWAPGGGRLVFYACPSNPIMADGRLYAVNAEGSGLTRLSNPPGGSPVVCYSEEVPAVAWSPDGAKLAYYSYTEPYGLYIVNSDGTGTRFLTAGGALNGHPKATRLCSSDGPMPQQKLIGRCRSILSTPTETGRANW